MKKICSILIRHNAVTLQTGRSVAQSLRIFLTQFSMVIPTFNEADNVDPLLTIKIIEVPICPQGRAHDVSDLSFRQ